MTIAFLGDDCTSWPVTHVGSRMDIGGPTALRGRSPDLGESSWERGRLARNRCGCPGVARNLPSFWRTRRCDLRIDVSGRVTIQSFLIVAKNEGQWTLNRNSGGRATVAIFNTIGPRIHNWKFSPDGRG